jgi:hypothetical protein
VFEAEWTIAGGTDSGGNGDETWTPATGITLNHTTLSMEIDQPAQLTATITPSDASDGVLWTSEKPALFSVDQMGLVTAHSTGRAEIKAKAGGVTATCTVSVAAALTAGLYEGDIEDGNQMDLSDFEDEYLNLLDKAFAWITGNSTEGEHYTIVLDSDITVDTGFTLGSGAGKSSSTGNGANNKNLKIKLVGLSQVRTIKLEGPEAGALFTVYGSVANGDDTPELILGENITLSGNAENKEVNTSALVVIGRNSGSRIGTLTMEAGSKITKNNNSYDEGGGVQVIFGTFEMKGGMIDHNCVASDTGGMGGGVAFSGSTFTMSGGSIEYNSAGVATWQGYGGGVLVGSSSEFVMSGGVIKNNKCVELNDGVAEETFLNTSGGGVSVMGTFTMSGDAEISGNSAEVGGGVNVGGTFSMQGGSIAGNRASIVGAAVHVSENGTSFAKTGGTIYGIADGENPNKKTDSASGTVHSIEIAEYDWDNLGYSTKFYYDETASSNVNLNSSDTSTNWTAVP